jgi:hydrogenase large subunit
MQVGPLAQVLAGFALGHKPTGVLGDQDARDRRLDCENDADACRAALDARAGTRRRMIRTQVIADLAEKHWNLLVNNIAKGDTGHLQRAGIPEG